MVNAKAGPAAPLSKSFADVAASPAKPKPRSAIPPPASPPPLEISRSQRANVLSVDTRLLPSHSPAASPTTEQTAFDRFEKEAGPLLRMSPLPSPPPVLAPRKAKVAGLQRLQHQPRPSSPRSDADGSDYDHAPSPNNNEGGDGVDSAADDDEDDNGDTRDAAKSKHSRGPIPHDIVRRLKIAESAYKAEVDALAQECDKSPRTLLAHINSIAQRRPLNDRNACLHAYSKSLGKLTSSLCLECCTYILVGKDKTYSGQDFKEEWARIKALPEEEYKVHVAAAREAYASNHLDAINWIKEEGSFDSQMKKTSVQLSRIVSCSSSPVNILSIVFS